MAGRRKKPNVQSYSDDLVDALPRFPGESACEEIGDGARGPANHLSLSRGPSAHGQVPWGKPDPALPRPPAGGCPRAGQRPDPRAGEAEVCEGLLVLGKSCVRGCALARISRAQLYAVASLLPCFFDPLGSGDCGHAVARLGALDLMGNAGGRSRALQSRFACGPTVLVAANFFAPEIAGQSARAGLTSRPAAAGAVRGRQRCRRNRSARR